MRGFGWFAVAAVLSPASTPAAAHAVLPGVGGFIGGVLHPLLIPAHALALVGLGLLIGRQQRRGIATLAFVMALSGALAALTFGLGETAAMAVLLAATTVTGLLVALALKIPTALVALLAIAVGAAIGLDSPPQEISRWLAYQALAGTAVGTVALVGLATVGGASLSRWWQTIAVRVIGSWIAASAILVLTLELSR